MRVALGNRNAIHKPDGPDQPAVKLPRGKRATVIEVDPETSLSSAFVSITHPAGIWATHATEGSRPAWVASDSPAMAQLLSAHYGDIEIRDLEARQLGAAVTATVGLMLATVALLVMLLRTTLLLRTNAGADFQAKQMAGSASATAVAKWVAITANSTAPSATDTTLTGEITTAGGGLVRQAGVYAHTTGAASYTLTSTFTANGSDSLPVTIAKRGVFDAASSGNLVFETLISPTATLSASGDSLTITDTVSL